MQVMNKSHEMGMKRMVSKLHIMVRLYIINIRDCIPKIWRKSTDEHASYPRKTADPVTASLPPTTRVINYYVGVEMGQYLEPGVGSERGVCHSAPFSSLNRYPARWSVADLYISASKRTRVLV